jgi:hypothetical protein
MNTWRAMLAAVPVRNAAAQVAWNAAGELEVTVAIERPRYLVWPLSWIVPHGSRRTVRLDKLGAQVWDLCDGQMTVGDVIDVFAERYQLTFHEARVAVTGYLQSLVQRGALAMAMPDDEAAE